MQRGTQDNCELVDKEVINVLKGSSGDRDRGQREALEEKIRILLIINFECYSK